MQFVDHSLGQFAAEVPVSLPIELIVDHDALRRADDPVRRGLKIAGQGSGIGIDQPRAAVESLTASRIEGAVRLHVIELAGPDPRYERAPDVTPAIGRGIQFNHVGRFAAGDLVVQEHTHRRRGTAEQNEMHAAVMRDRPVGERMREVKRRMRDGHDEESDPSAIGPT